MRYTPAYVMDDPREVVRLVRRHPWATFVSATSKGLVASHYPVLVEPGAGSEATPGSTSEDIILVTHFGRPDDQLHEVGDHEVLVIIQGPHDYVSSSWYAPGDIVPTWNHVTAHLYGVPEVLGEEENFAMLSRLTDHFERHHPGGRSLFDDEPAARRAARGTVGLRIRVTRFDARAKLSQRKPEPVVDEVIRQLDTRNPDLAAEMRRVQGQSG